MIEVLDKQVSEKRELPKGWQWVRCAEVIDVRDGTHESPKYQSQGIPLVTSKNLISGKIDFGNVSYISEDDHKQIAKRSKVDKGDILFAMIGTIGNPVLVNIEKEFSIKNVALFKFTHDQVNANYFRYLLESDIIQLQLTKATNGGTQKFVSLKALRDLLIPLPPLETQKRIAALLDEQMAAVAQARKAAEEGLEAASKLTLGYLKTIFESDAVTSSQQKAIGDIAKTSSGSTPSRSRKDYYGGETPWVKTTELKDRIINKAEETITVTTQVLDDGFRNLKSTSLGRICLAQKSYICTMNSISY